MMYAATSSNYNSYRTMKSFVLLCLALTAMVAVSVVKAWGEIGHEIVANIAWSRLDDDPQLQMHLRKVLNVTQSLPTTTTVTGNDHEDDHLNDYKFYNDDQDPGSPFADVANWADHVRHFLPWSGQLHFIDVQDEIIDGGCHYRPQDGDDYYHGQRNNNNKCMFYYERDCVDNDCVAGAILNYSTQLLPALMAQQHQLAEKHQLLGLDSQAIQRRRHLQRRSLRGHQKTNLRDGDYAHQTNVTIDPYHQKQALMFLIHFIGDIHQPLHVSRQTDKGGNDIHVHYQLKYTNDDGGSTSNIDTLNHHAANLHSVWDTSMIETSLHRSYGGNRTKMENHLYELLEQHPKWEDHYLNGPTCGTNDGYGLNRTCVVSWGQESWKMALKFAYTDVDEVTDIASGDTISEEYYESRLPIIEERLIAGGVRLAATIRAIFRA
mmetsp:Transcript_61608/g.150820  ORF Transcript_61608/g.150820 Transcript_61608/m.150820 type:complete len:434 (+) Transcript_61608:206-1507(+)